MTTDKLQELRKLAQEAEDFRKLQQGSCDNGALRTAYNKRIQAYVNALYESPATILQLLDEIERLRCCGTCKRRLGVMWCSKDGRELLSTDRCDEWGAMK